MYIWFMIRVLIIGSSFLCSVESILMEETLLIQDEIEQLTYQITELPRIDFDIDFDDSLDYFIPLTIGLDSATKAKRVLLYLEYDTGSETTTGYSRWWLTTAILSDLRSL